MSARRRILFTGARDWADPTRAYLAFDTHVRRDDIVVHGGAKGLDSLIQSFCEVEGVETEVHPADRFRGPLKRNEFMVSLGANVCLAFANRWASGTGNCARLARKAGIHTIDYGVSTHPDERAVASPETGEGGHG